MKVRIEKDLKYKKCFALVYWNMHKLAKPLFTITSFQQRVSS